MDPVAARTALTHERDRLQRDLAHLRGDADAEPRDSADRLDAGPDDAVATYDHEFDESVAEGLEAALAEVEEALGRIDAGTYGRCVDCGGEIPPKRLAALPASARCVECQRKRER
ncbi:MAG: TraR/DksA family transcriptional regulator [Actinomycetota bacterium]